MKVELISCTPDALDLLIFTKNTRLTISGASFDEVKQWTLEKKYGELNYMRHTIQSSWEFVEYVFVITGVSRAMTQQLERHRIGTSFAEQSQRVVDMSEFTYSSGPSINASLGRGQLYDDAMALANARYKRLLADGADPQDARGVLPMATHSNLVFKANLRTLHDMALKRLCVRTQGEFQDMFRALLEEVFTVHPWARSFLRVQCAWDGTCLFPALPLDKCPVKPRVYNPETAEAYGGGRPATTAEIYQIHRDRRATPQPMVSTVQQEFDKAQTRSVFSSQAGGAGEPS